MVVIAIATTLTLVACMGKDMGDFVKVATPIGIQKSDGVPPKLTLNEAEYEYSAWFDRTQGDGTQWRGLVMNGRDSAALLSSLALQVGKDAQAHPAVAMIPGLGLLIGYATRRFGDASPSQLAEKQKASYNKGQKDVLTALDTRSRTTDASNASAAELIAIIKAEVAKTA